MPNKQHKGTISLVLPQGPKMPNVKSILFIFFFFHLVVKTVGDVTYQEAVEAEKAFQQLTSDIINNKEVVPDAENKLKKYLSIITSFFGKSDQTSPSSAVSDKNSRIVETYNAAFDQIKNLFFKKQKQNLTEEPPASTTEQPNTTESPIVQQPIIPQPVTLPPSNQQSVEKAAEMVTDAAKQIKNSLASGAQTVAKTISKKAEEVCELIEKSDLAQFGASVKQKVQDGIVACQTVIVPAAHTQANSSNQQTPVDKKTKLDEIVDVISTKADTLSATAKTEACAMIDAAESSFTELKTLAGKKLDTAKEVCKTAFKKVKLPTFGEDKPETKVVQKPIISEPVSVPVSDLKKPKFTGPTDAQLAQGVEELKTEAQKRLIETKQTADAARAQKKEEEKRLADEKARKEKEAKLKEESPKYPAAGGWLFDTTIKTPNEKDVTKEIPLQVTIIPKPVESPNVPVKQAPSDISQKAIEEQPRKINPFLDKANLDKKTIISNNMSNPFGSTDTKQQLPLEPNPFLSTQPKKDLEKKAPEKVIKKDTDPAKKPTEKIKEPSKTKAEEINNGYVVLMNKFSMFSDELAKTTSISEKQVEMFAQLHIQFKQMSSLEKTQKESLETILKESVNQLMTLSKKQIENSKTVIESKAVRRANYVARWLGLSNDLACAVPEKKEEKSRFVSFSGFQELSKLADTVSRNVMECLDNNVKYAKADEQHKVVFDKDLTKEITEEIDFIEKSIAESLAPVAKLFDDSFKDFIKNAEKENIRTACIKLLGINNNGKDIKTKIDQSDKSRSDFFTGNGILVELLNLFKRYQAKYKDKWKNLNSDQTASKQAFDAAIKKLNTALQKVSPLSNNAGLIKELCESNR